MALPEVGLMAVIDGLSSFEKGAKSITTAYDEIDKKSKSVEGTSASLSSQFNTLGQSVLGFGAVAAGVAAAGVTALTAGMIAFGKSAIDSASDAAEMESLFTIVFGEDAPKAAQELEKFAQTVGRNKYELKGFAGSIAALVGPMGLTQGETTKLSTGFAELAVDLSSFFNVTEEDALAALKSGLVGESEPLRKFGVTLNEATINQEAFNLGISDGKRALTAAEKAQVIYSLVMKQTAQAQGDALRTSGGWANQTRALTATFEEFKTEIGTQLIPVLAPLLQTFTGMARDILPLVADTFKNQIVPAIQSVITTASNLFSAFQSGGIGGLVGALGLTPATTELIGKVVATIAELGKTIMGILAPAFDYLTSGGALNILNTVITFVNDNFEAFKGALMGVAAVLGGAAIATAIAGIASAIGALATPITAIIAVAALLGAAWQSDFMGIRTAVVEFWDKYAKPAFIELGKWMQVNVPKAIKKLQDAFNILIKKVMPELIAVFEIIRKWVDKNWPLIQKTITKVIETIGEIIKNFTKSTSAFWDEWGDTIMVVTDFVMKYIWNNIKTAMKNILDVITLTMQIITGDWKGAWETISGILDRNLNNIVTNVTSSFNAIQSIITSILSNVISVVTSSWSSIVSIITTAATNAYNAVVTQFNKFSGYISGLASTLYTAAQTMMQGIINGINAMLSNVTSTLLGVVNSAINTLISAVLSGGQLYTNLLSIGSNLIKGITDGISSGIEIANKIWSGLLYAFDTVVAWVKNTGYDVYKKALLVGSNIVTAISAGLVFYSNTASDFVNSVWAGLLNSINTVYTWATNTGYALYKAALKVGGEIVQAIVDGFNGAQDIFNNLSEVLKDWIMSWFSPIPEAEYAGSEIVGNIISGFLAQQGLFTSTLRGSLTGWISGATGGLSASVNALPNLSAQLQAMVSAPVAAPAMATAGSTVNNYNTFHVGGNTIGNGMDAAAFEQRVLNVIRKNL